MSKEPSDMLSEEIDDIMAMIDIFEVMLNKLQSNQEVNMNDLKKVINFFRVYVHMSHNKKEQLIVFPELEKSENLTHKELLKELTSEKHLSEFYIYALIKIFKHVLKGDAEQQQKLVTLMRKYITLEKKHVQKEKDNILPLCTNLLSPEKNERLSIEFKLQFVLSARESDYS